MTTVKWRSFRNFSGPLAKADPLHGLDIPTMKDDHWERAFWLTTMVESGGRSGLVNMYDGCGATCGLHQAVAVYPQDMGGTNQGPLWDLLWRLDAVVPLSYYPLWERISKAGWRLTGDGLVWENSGTRVTSKNIRDQLTPLGGKVPKEGTRWEHARDWATAFSEVFQVHQGLRTQTRFGIEHMQRSAKRVKVKVRGVSKTIESWCYSGKALAATTLYLSEDPELDLAMCLFWCNFINGPNPAKKALQSALEATGGPASWGSEDFAKALILALGNNKYGRWDDDIPGGRYARAYLYATDVWPGELFADYGVMPKDLPD